MSSGSLLYSTIGDLLRQRRIDTGISVHQLQEMSGVHRTSITRIENGEIKRPEFVTVQRIANAMNIPFEETVEYYICADQKSDTLFLILEDTIPTGNISLTSKVALKYLESPNEDSYDSIERLYNTTSTCKADPALKLSLFQSIVSYARDHGVMPYIAKGQLQSYLIERNDFTKLKATYYNGRYILPYSHFLSTEERIMLHYKLGVHSYNLRLFQESIELCSVIVAQNDFQGQTKADAIGIMCDSYERLGNYEKAEEYLKLYDTYTYKHVKEHVKVTTATLHDKKGNTALAISLFNELLEKVSENSLLHVVNKLIKLQQKMNNLLEIEKLLTFEEKITSFSYTSPYKQSELALFYKLKGDYQVAMGEIIEGANCYLESALKYAKVDDSKNERLCIGLILDLQINNSSILDNLILKKLRSVYCHPENI
ncbi:helix-turn-helix domain-containing protein [Paenibacillus sp. 481]|uniref:helix-turn-helix domain-containing protein n=1 Tax=Paenibacillus sp. 481 TaxID=2835869 RepID=UPI001E6176E5|nr:helix-turn-helix transcriptional regulator [Paenibacillus sp. 481]UHA75626.1 helix-turn-helix transcriptional regulator [Paenibacillus sp. 481]